MQTIDNSPLNHRMYSCGMISDRIEPLRIMRFKHDLEVLWSLCSCVLCSFQASLSTIVSHIKNNYLVSKFSHFICLNFLTVSFINYYSKHITKVLISGLPLSNYTKIHFLVSLNSLNYVSSKSHERKLRHRKENNGHKDKELS